MALCKQCDKGACPEQDGGKEFRLQHFAPFAHRYNPACHRRTDIGSHDDAGCLQQINNSGIDKADYHDGSCGTALNNSRDARSHQNAEDPVGCQDSKQLLEPVACKFLKAVAIAPIP